MSITVLHTNKPPCIRGIRYKSMTTNFLAFKQKGCVTRVFSKNLNNEKTLKQNGNVQRFNYSSDATFQKGKRL